MIAARPVDAQHAEQMSRFVADMYVTILYEHSFYFDAYCFFVCTLCIGIICIFCDVVPDHLHSEH